MDPVSDSANVKVYIADQYEAIRMVVSGMVSMYVSDIAQIHQFDNSDDLLLALLPERGPVGMVVLDLELPGYRKRLALLNAMFELRPDLKVMVYTSAESQHLMLRAVDVGIGGYILKRSGYRPLVHGFEHVLLEKGQYVDDSVDLVQAVRHPWWTLTAAERETVVNLAKGLSLREIAQQTERAYKTISVHKYNAQHKLGVPAKTNLATYLYEQGLDFELDR